MKLKNKLALVTGAGRGIGAGCALELARGGADVVINDLPDSEGVGGVADQIRAMGRDCTVVHGDVFTRDGREALLARALEVGGRVDILVSNPTVSSRCSFLDFDLDEFKRTFDGALVSGFDMSRIVARHMVDRGGGGKIIFISSVHGELPFARAIAYGAAKAALNQMTRTISVELCSHHINVNAIEPGWIDTPGERIIFGDDTIDRTGPELPWGRMGVPADIGHAVAFLASDDADYITGVILPVDGGIRFKDMR